MRANMPASYIESHRARLERRHYITDAFTDTMWFNFFEGRVRDFIHNYAYDFCMVINGSPFPDHAFVLPFEDFRDFFSPDLLDETHRWVGTIRAHDEAIRISHGRISKTRPVFEYHNAFQLLQDAPPYLPAGPNTDLI